MPSDTERLDWLEAQSTEGVEWIARPSSTGRGYRLHQTSRDEGSPTVRQAIDKAMGREEESTEH